MSVIRRLLAVPAIIALAGVLAFAGKPELAPVRAALEARDYDKALALLKPMMAAGESSGEAFYLQGAAELGQKDWAEAEKSLSSAIEKRYQEPEVLIAEARALIGAGRPQDVAALLTKPLAKVKDPKVGAAYKSALGQAEMAQGNYSKAQEWLLGARFDDEDDLDYRVALGDAYYKGQVYPLATSEYEAVLASDSTRLDIMYKLADTYYHQRKLNEARPLLIKLLEKDSTYNEAYFKLANIYMIAAQSRSVAEAQVQYKAALSLYRKVREVDPKADPVLVAKNIATVYYLLNAHDSAIVELQHAIQTGATDPELYFFLGRSNMLLGHYDSAITAFNAYRAAREKATPPQQWVKSDAELFWRTATCMEALKDSTLLPQIADNYRRAVDLDPDDDRAIGGLALAYHKLGRYAEAAVEFEKLVVRHPNDTRTLFNAALPYLQSDNNEKAVEYLMRAAASDTTADLTFRFRAYKLAAPRLVKMQHSEDAQAAYKLLVAREPDNCENQKWYGYSFFVQKNYSPAIPPLRRAYQCYTSSGAKPCSYNDLRWWLAFALYDTGAKDESYKLLEQIMKCEPNQADAKQLMNRIDDETIEKN
ncbi:MAG: tetratricopeptide repeat protein [candidate division Zixibacteria bacterium]|nr:tetratricopeptide repeat protein [candidate division Zixibacteria bacterium]